MTNAGVYAGEVTNSAPADEAPTLKARSYQWMEYGMAAPVGNCNEVWNIGTLVPDLQVAGMDSLGVWDSGVIIGAGVLADDHTTNLIVPSLAGAYDQIGATVVGAMGLFECQRYIYAGPDIHSDLQYPASDLTSGSWTPTGTGTRTFDQVGIAGTPNSATLLTDTDIASAYRVAVTTPFLQTNWNGNPETVRVIVKKDLAATQWMGVLIQFSVNLDEVFALFSPATGAHSVESFTGTGAVSDSVDRGDWWEFYVQIDKPGVGLPLGETTVSVWPAASIDGLVLDNAATGAVTVGNMDIVQDFAIGIIRGGANGLKLGLPSGTINESLAYIDLANFDQTEGGIYFEWRPMYSHSEITGDVEILSLNGGLGLLYYDYSTLSITATDGTNTVAIPITLTKDTKYRLGVAWGFSLAVGVDNAWSAPVAYDGAFPTATQFDVLTAPEAVNYWRELRGFWTPYAEALAEINKLMSGV